MFIIFRHRHSPNLEWSLWLGSRHLYSDDRLDGISRNALAAEHVKSMAMVGPQPVPPHSTTPYTAGIQCLGFCWLSCTGFNMQAAMLSDAAIEEDLLSRRAGTKYFFNLFTVEGLSTRPALPAPKTAANQEDQPTKGPKTTNEPKNTKPLRWETPAVFNQGRG